MFPALDRHHRALRFAVAGATLLLVAKGALRYRHAIAQQANVSHLPASHGRGWSVDSLNAAAAVAARSQAFGAARPQVPRTQRADARPTPPVPSGPMPVLQGVLGGPPWSAIVAGLPSMPSPVVLRPGDTVAGFIVGRMTRDTVVLRGAGRTYFITWAR
jgi:hypothetical protein